MRLKEKVLKSIFIFFVGLHTVVRLYPVNPLGGSKVNETSMVLHRRIQVHILAEKMVVCVFFIKE